MSSKVSNPLIKFKWFATTRRLLGVPVLAAVAATALVGGVTMSDMASAQEVPARVAAKSVATVNTSKWVVGSKAELIRVPLNKAITLRIAEPVRNVIVAQPGIADIILPEDGGRNYVYVVARAIGSTTMIFEGTRGNILFEGDIQVDVDVAGIQAALADMLPEEKITVSSHRGGVFIKGFVRSASASTSAVNIARRYVPDSLNIINSLEVLNSQQVILQVRIAEIKRTALKGLGVDLTITDGAGISGSTTLSALPEYVTGTFSQLAGLPGISNITIEALEEQGFAKTLAEPTLTAISGETASFLAGGSFPMTTSIDTNGTVTYEQKPFGILLDFTPVVLDKGRINLQVSTEVSDRDDAAAVNGIPGLTQKRTETTIDLPSGGTMYIAGLIQNDTFAYVEGIPGLKDIPVLGQLFRSEGFRNEETELVVTITAYLAKPTSNNAALSLPTDGFAIASDIDFLLLGQLHRVYTKKELPPYATPLAGPYGYIME